jgi:uncharacterized protein (TIGR02145 family)
MKILLLITATAFYMQICNAQTGTVTDIDGNIYQTIIIGTQVWMKENLKTTHYRNGDSIGTTYPATLDYMNESTPKYQWAYNNDSLAAIYGRLYTWHAITDTRKVCPAGWHVPAVAEWRTLVSFLGGDMLANGKLKETGTIHWKSPNVDATNESGFTGLPGGTHWGGIGFDEIGVGGHYWSATPANADEAWRLMLNYQYLGANTVFSYADKKIGWNVRCIEDPIPDSVKYFGQTPPGNVPVQFATGIITGYVHGTLAISPKSDEIYWVVNPSTERIMYSKFENGTWTAPALADFVKDFLTNNNGNPTFSPDGKKMFFYSDRPGGMGSYDTWYVERTDSGWSSPINAGTPYNTADADLTPLFTNKGKAYHLGYNNKHEEITSCYKYSNNKFTDSTPMDILPEYGPWWTLYISPEEDYLIFASGADNADLYIRFKNKDGQWGTPISMGDKINTTVWERFPVVSPDGKYLFFERELASNNLFWVSTTIIDSLRNAITGIQLSPNDKKLSVFPNPSEGVFTITLASNLAKNATAEIFSMDGKMALRQTIWNKSGTIDMADYAKGIYILKITADSKIFTQKISLK